ncbi:MAG: hypothetical protein ACKOPG_03630, partial [Novosphingobium sp.]
LANDIGAIAYDSATGGYTVTVAGAPQTFTPANLVAAKSTPQVNVYEIASAGSKSSLTLTKPGTAGSLTYRFVGGALWQRLTDTATGIDGRFSALTYGIRTPDSVVFSGGGARFAVDVLGAYLADSTLGGSTPLSGTGQMLVNFGDGTFSILAGINGRDQTPATYSAEGKLTSGQNFYNGTVRIVAPGKAFYLGSLSGNFFGPAVNEIGGQWATFQPNSSGVVSDYAAGLVIGRRGTVMTTAPSFTGLASPQVFSATGSHFVQPFGSSAGTAQISQNGVSVHYDPATDSYALILSDSFLSQTSLISETYAGNYILIDNGNTKVSGLDGLNVYTGSAGIPLTYVRAADWLTQPPGTLLGHSFVFGYATPSANVPRTGQATYAVSLGGMLVRSGPTFPIRDGLTGSGTIAADFVSGALTLTGLVDARDVGIQFQGPPTASGIWSGNGLIASNANSLTGTVLFDFGSVGTYNGNFAGQFFGPAAEEIGVSFSATGPAGSLSGSAMGKKN